MQYTVRSLSPYTEYDMYVIAVNAIGRGPPSTSIVVTTGETGNVFTLCNVLSTCVVLKKCLHYTC